MVDDNFIGNKRNVKILLNTLKGWMAEHQYPFHFSTEASVDLAKDQELMDLMVECNFNGVFLGIETPDESSLTLTQKYQNTRDSLADAVDAIARTGLRVMAGFIIGFDGETAGAGDRIVRFVEQTTIPIALFSMLQALPDTALWHRLKREGRLIEADANINQTTLMNFVPTRPIEDIAREYVESFWKLYDPKLYLDRAYRHFLKLGAPRHRSRLRKISWKVLRAFAIICWRQGVVRESRFQFWHHLFGILRHNPRVLEHYIAVCALNEHFVQYRTEVRSKIEAQLQAVLEQETMPRIPAQVAR
jgi:radical SAM superfamily enzyme YgiQ (UPF0313 family)